MHPGIVTKEEMQTHDHRMCELEVMCGGLAEVEMRILIRVAERLKMGQTQYGKLSRMDRRQWRDELAEELLDALAYIEIAKELGK